MKGKYRIKDRRSRILYEEDCLRIQAILAGHETEATLEECQALWKLFSASYAAGWLALPETDRELWDRIEMYLEEAK